MKRRRRGGKPRKTDAKREADGTVVRRIWARGAQVSRSFLENLSDTVKAKLVDPRHGSAAGRLELQHEADVAAKAKLPGGITRLERLAGERWAMKLTTYRNRDIHSPAANARAANLVAGTGQAREADWDSLDEDTKDQIRRARSEYQEAEMVILDLAQGRKIESILHNIFICDQDVALNDVALVRIGLRALILHFGLASEQRDA